MPNWVLTEQFFHFFFDKKPTQKQNNNIQISSFFFFYFTFDRLVWDTTKQLTVVHVLVVILLNTHAHMPWHVGIDLRICVLSAIVFFSFFHFTFARCLLLHWQWDDIWLWFNEILAWGYFDFVIIEVGNLIILQKSADRWLTNPINTVQVYFFHFVRSDC